MTKKEIFLVDSNSFMTPYRKYYAFDLVPAYWDVIIEPIKDGKIVVLDIVRDEITKGEDDLAEWIVNVDELKIIRHVNEETVNKYQEVLQFVATSGYYKKSAFLAWAQGGVADPWLIASAAVNGYTLVTEEIGTGVLSTKQQQKAAKIPDVAGEFKVETINIYEMMRRLEIVIK